MLPISLDRAAFRVSCALGQSVDERSTAEVGRMLPTGWIMAPPVLEHGLAGVALAVVPGRARVQSGKASA